MFELILYVVIIGVMAKIAGMMNKSGLVWAGVTFGICVASLLLPWPFMRAFIAFIVAFGAIFVAEMVKPTQN